MYHRFVYRQEMSQVVVQSSKGGQGGELYVEKRSSVLLVLHKAYWVNVDREEEEAEMWLKERRTEGELGDVVLAACSPRGPGSHRLHQR